MKKSLRHQHVLAALLLATSGSVAAQNDATELSLEDLLKTEVVTVARKSQTLQNSAAAVFIINRDDIERSGATSIPEALRLAPGVQVARISNNRWAVSVRGFNGRFSNKLLVLMDGRSIYSQLFSGVIWEAEDTLLEDIDRIEVIRGPGAAMWGANAMNGVINIITRKSRDTQGVLVAAGAGAKEGELAAARFGGATENGHFRVWGKGFSRDESVNLAGQDANDHWDAARMGFRGDWTLASGRRLMLSGGAHQGTNGERWDIPDANRLAFVSTNMKQTNEGVHLLGRYDWQHDDGSESVLQAYAESSEIDIQQQIREQRDTVDFDFQHRTALAKTHDLMWGLGYRQSRDQIDAQGIFLVDPPQRDFRLFSAFLQDDITMQPDTWRLILGLRLEDNNDTGFSSQPNARLMWTPDPNRTFWASAARAVRTPSRTERDAQADLWLAPPSAETFGLPMMIRYTPQADRELDNEKVTSYELGYRQQLGSRLSVDAAFFYNEYDDLRSAMRSTGSPQVGASGPYVLQTIVPDNVLKATSDGVELLLDYHATSWWRLQPSYTYLHVSGQPVNADPINQNYSEFLTNNAPQHHVALRSSMNLPGHQQFDLWYRYVSRIAVASVNGGSVPSYSTLDLRYGWRFMPGWEIALVGQNLIDPRHVEFWQDQLPAEITQIERSWYAKLKVQF